MSPKVLFVFTSANKTLTGAQTGWYLPEAAHPYYGTYFSRSPLHSVLISTVYLLVLIPHAEVDFAAPAGPNPPIDESSVEVCTSLPSPPLLSD